MKKLSILLAIITALLASHSFAACPTLAKQSVSKNLRSNKVTSDTYRDFYKALKHYRTEISADSGADFRAKIEALNTYLKGPRITGYELIISHGGDESTVRYVLDSNKKLIVAYWYNQSPLTYWFCGSDITDEVDETLDGTEI